MYLHNLYDECYDDRENYVVEEAKTENLKAKIDATCYPIVRTESKEKLVAPRRARHILEFRPSTIRGHDFLLYFQDEEEGGEN